MARHAQPRELAELKGATRHDPQRYKKKAPKSEVPLGNAPEHMTAEAKATWFEIAGYALPGVLTGADRFMLEVAAELLAEFRSNPAAFKAAKLGHMVGALARLGLSPSDRQKLKIDEPPESNPFNAF